MNGDMSMQLSGADDGYGSQRSRGSARPGTSGGNARPMSSYGGQGAQQRPQERQRSKSVADGRQFNKDGRPILHFGKYSNYIVKSPTNHIIARALYMYQAAIPEELSFGKGEVLAVLRLQDDGWWEAEVAGKNGRPGLVPSNYLQNC